MKDQKLQVRELHVSDTLGKITEVRSPDPVRSPVTVSG